jgi:hypothetical protein
VFIDGVAGPATPEQVAAAIAARYGLPADAIAARMKAGRFRVKSDVDLPTARRFADDLARLGAQSSVVDAASGAVVPGGAATPAPTPAPTKPAAPTAVLPAAPSKPAAAPLLPAASKPAAPSSVLPARAGVAPPADVGSGLAAALADGADGQDLGVLGADSDSFSLATLDGDEERPPASAQEGAAFAPGEEAFAPPDADDADLALAVDVDVDVGAAPAAEPPPAGDVAADDELLQLLPEGSAPAAPGAPVAASRPSPLARARAYLASRERERFIAGVLLALLVGFVPAHVFASVRESSAYAEVRRDVARDISRVETVEDWERLDVVLRAQRDIAISKRNTIAVTGVLVWAGFSAGFAFVWFRKIDWERPG